MECILTILEFRSGQYRYANKVAKDPRNGCTDRQNAFNKSCQKRIPALKAASCHDKMLKPCKTCVSSKKQQMAACFKHITCYLYSTNKAQNHGSRASKGCNVSPAGPHAAYTPQKSCCNTWKSIGSSLRPQKSSHCDAECLDHCQRVHKVQAKRVRTNFPALAYYTFRIFFRYQLKIFADGTTWRPLKSKTKLFKS